MTMTALRHSDPASARDVEAALVHGPPTPSPGWWCPLCVTEAAPSWLGRSETIAYHRFGAPPFIARHALVPVGRRAGSAPGLPQR
jgi:hypothetical protein